MPTNLPAKWYIAKKEYENAKSLEEKIEKLKVLISVTPKHKGTENLLAQLKKKLSKLEEMKEHKHKTHRREGKFKKVGDILVAIIGLTNSGKSTLLKSLTNASVEIGKNAYTTRELETGVCRWKGVYIQFVEIPSFFKPSHLSVARNADLIIILTRNSSELNEISRILKTNGLWNKKKIFIERFLSGNIEDFQKNKDYSQLLDGILRITGVIRIFLKPKNKKQIDEDAVVFNHNPTVREVVLRINKKWLESFKFARIIGKKLKKVGLDYLLEDGDVIEIHA